jgi:hypothetical protein
MGFNSVKSLVESMDNGQTCYSTFRKTITQQTSFGCWYDLSMASGSPVTNYYASEPLVAATLDGNKGIYSGPLVSPQSKFLKSTSLLVTSANLAVSMFTLCDYLLYYPFVDGDETSEQLFDNTTSLPRYESGDGVKAFVVAQGTYVGGAKFSISYTNQDGVSGRISQSNTSNVATNTASLITSGVLGGAGTTGQMGPFITLAQGDTGIRSIQSITFETANSGIYAVVLCKPLANMVTREITAPSEKDFYIDNGGAMPEIKDGAFLALLGLSQNVIGQPLMGTIETVWN